MSAIQQMILAAYGGIWYDPNALLLEDSSYLLLEDGSKLLLEA